MDDSYRREPSYHHKYLDRPPFDPSNVNKSMEIINRSEARIKDLKKKMGKDQLEPPIESNFKINAP